MAIPFSTPQTRKDSTNKRESLAKIAKPTETTLDDLNQSSRLFYDAMVEALDILQDIASEQNK